MQSRMQSPRGGEAYHRSNEMKGSTLADSITTRDYWDRGRPPFAPLAHVEQRREHLQKFPEPPPPQRVVCTRSEYDDVTYLDDENPDKFELMNVSVIIYGLSGIMCDKEPPKKKRSKFGNTKDRLSNRKGSVGKSLAGRAFSGSAFSGSTISSVDNMSATEEGLFIESQNAPTTAVLSYRKNAFSSQTSLETFIPSTPLHHPTVSFGPKFRYAAWWPSELSTLTKDDGAIERSSFKLIRCMQQEAFVPGAGVGSNYVHETVELRINLSRGTELIRLGTASLVISGEEEGVVQMNIPTRPLLQKSNRKRFKSKAKSKSNKHGYFSSDPTRRYYLDENATIRVGVQVIPQHTVKIAEERERKENDLKILLGTNDLKQMIKNMGDENLERSGQNPIRNFSLADVLPVASPKGQQPAAPSKGVFSNLFCGAILCAPDSLDQEQDVPEKPVEIIHTKNEYGQLGLGPLMSSVSESTDGSDCYSEGEMEAQFNQFRMTADFQR